MEEVAVAGEVRGVGRGSELPHPLRAPPSPRISSTCSPTEKLSEAHPFGMLRRLHYRVMLD